MPEQINNHKAQTTTADEAQLNQHQRYTGKVVSVRGSVVDVYFEEHLPPIHTLVYGMDDQVVTEVITQLDNHHVRSMAMTPTQGLARGMEMYHSGTALQAPVGKPPSRACSTCSAIPLTMARN